MSKERRFYQVMPFIALLFMLTIGLAIPLSLERSNPKPGDVYSYEEKNPFLEEKHTIKILRVQKDRSGSLWVEYSYMNGDSVSQFKQYSKWATLKDVYYTKVK